jgi:DNA-binding GntR family transcriptional regulator
MSINSLDENKNLPDQVAEIVIERICNGNFTPGMRLGERKLARDLGISQIPVREAFEKLIQRGWIEKIPQRSAFIKKFDADEIGRLFEMRKIIEAGAIYLVIPAITEEQIQTLEKLANCLQIASQNGDIAVYEKTDMEFHLTIISFIKNPRISEMYKNILDQSHNLFFSAAVKAAFSWGGQLETDTSGHHKIVNALKERNSQKAQQEIISHLERGCQFAAMIAQAQSILKPKEKKKKSCHYGNSKSKTDKGS